MPRGEVTRQAFGNAAGTPVEVFTLTNARGLEIRAMTYGAIITSIRVPDRKGVMADVALGFDAARGIPRRASLFRRRRRPLRQPHRQARRFSRRQTYQLRRTTARITCTAASAASTSTSGRPSRSPA